MKDNREALRPYIADMIAVEKHIQEALERQQKDDDVKQFPNAAQFVDRSLSLLRSHVQVLENHLEGFPGGSAAGAVKGAVTGVLGAVAGLYDKVRTETASRALRDDYTALSLASVSYSMLYTTALGLRQGATAEIALRHLKDLAPLIMQLSEIIPPVVLKELSFEGYEIESSLAQQVARNIQQAWSSEARQETVGAGVTGSTLGSGSSVR